MENIFTPLNFEKSVVYKGLTFEVTDEPDCGYSAPWENSDGHGVVSDWETRRKYPSERILSKDRGNCLYYDVQESIEKAKKEGWQPCHTNPAGLSKRQIAALAVEEDFQRLKDWCDEKWWYTFIKVSVGLNGDELGYDSVGGVESDCGSETFLEIANDLSVSAYDTALSCLKQRLADYNEVLKLID